MKYGYLQEKNGYNQDAKEYISDLRVYCKMTYLLFIIIKNKFPLLTAECITFWWMKYPIILQTELWLSVEKLSSSTLDFIRSNGNLRCCDTWAIQQQAHKGLFLDHINSIDPCKKLTVEGNQDNGTIPFLDTLVQPESDNSLSIKVYHKATNTDQYLQWDSHHNLLPSTVS